MIYREIFERYLRDGQDGLTKEELEFLKTGEQATEDSTQTKGDRSSRAMKAYFVFGAEATGTRLLTRILLKAGCAGSDDHVQPFDTELPEATEPIVWRRSFPHNHQWPDISTMHYQALKKGYAPCVIVTNREWAAVRRSQVHGEISPEHPGIHHVATDEQAIANIREAYLRIYKGLLVTGMPFVTVSYEGLYQRPQQTILNLFDILGWPEGTPVDVTIPVRDENAKWFGDSLK